MERDSFSSEHSLPQALIMTNTIVVLVVLVASVLAEQRVLDVLRNREITKAEMSLSGAKLVEHLNSKQGFFKAKLNPRFSEMSLAEKRMQMGVRSVRLDERARNNLSPTRFADIPIPSSFDSRDAWPECPSIGTIRDQSSCGSCWAVGAAEAISDRICIASNGSLPVLISAEDILTCCDFCGDGCYGGIPYDAFQFWVDQGVVSGGNYGDKSTCQPYPFENCEHHTTGKFGACGDFYDTPDCSSSCQEGYATAYDKDKHFGKSVYGVDSDVSAIQKEILLHGPVEAAFTVYEDFEHYSSGVYVHTAGEELGGHAVKLIGWGEEAGVPYWLVANSWNEDWGENGYFRIIRGIDEVDFESGIVAGLPR